MDQHLLVAWLHNGFTVQAAGNPSSTGVLEELLIPNPLVRSIAVYQDAPLNTDRTLLRKTTYLQLREKRETL